MRTFGPVLGVLILIAIVFFGVPMLAEGTGNVCQALEKQAVTNAATDVAGQKSGPVYNTINKAGQSAATGQVASGIMNQQHPDTPTPVACTWYYWKSILG
jgi:hypothetical protein